MLAPPRRGAPGRLGVQAEAGRDLGGAQPRRAPLLRGRGRRLGRAVEADPRLPRPAAGELPLRLDGVEPGGRRARPQGRGASRAASGNHPSTRRSGRDVTHRSASANAASTRPDVEERLDPGARISRRDPARPPRLHASPARAAPAPPEAAHRPSGRATKSAQPVAPRIRARSARGSSEPARMHAANRLVEPHGRGEGPARDPQRASPVRPPPPAQAARRGRARPRPDRASAAAAESNARRENASQASGATAIQTARPALASASSRSARTASASAVRRRRERERASRRQRGAATREQQRAHGPPREPPRPRCALGRKRCAAPATRRRSIAAARAPPRARRAPGRRAGPGRPTARRGAGRSRSPSALRGGRARPAA